MFTTSFPSYSTVFIISENEFKPHDSNRGPIQFKQFDLKDLNSNDMASLKRLEKIYKAFKENRAVLQTNEGTIVLREKEKKKLGIEEKEEQSFVVKNLGGRELKAHVGIISDQDYQEIQEAIETLVDSLKKIFAPEMEKKGSPKEKTAKEGPAIRIDLKSRHRVGALEKQKKSSGGASKQLQEKSAKEERRRQEKAEERKKFEEEKDRRFLKSELRKEEVKAFEIKKEGLDRRR